MIVARTSDGRTGASRKIDVKDTNLDGVTVKLKRSASIKGTVLAGEGPLAHAYVSLFRTRRGEKQESSLALPKNRYRAQAAEDGAFRLQGLPVGTYLLSVEDENGRLLVSI